MSGSDLLNTASKCVHCAGRVTNSTGRRLTIEQLTEVHRASCPGLTRVRKKG